MANPIEIDIEVPKNPNIDVFAEMPEKSNVEVNPRERFFTTHNELIGRDESNAHTINAITGLRQELDSKQGNIPDLETIRSNATEGKHASETISNYGDIVTHNKSEFATASQGVKADNALPNTTKYGASVVLSINQTTFVMTLQLKDQDGNNLGSSQTIDLPLESVVVGGAYDSENKKIILTLENGTTIDVPVGDLVAGLQTEITVDNKLSADLVNDESTTNKLVTTSEKNTWNNKQDAISDLDTIRAGASEGSTAVQPDDLQIELDEKIDKGYSVNDFATNCITEIPQDIKLELSNGTLTLKSGSIITFPDGSQYQTIQDTTAYTGSSTGTYIICVKSNHTIYIEREDYCYSGSTAPSGHTTMLWYDTTNNVVKATSDGGSTWDSGYSLSIAICSKVSGSWTSIDKVFNGAGYIGHHAFVLPDVKMLIPDGFNVDGTLKSINRTNNALRIIEISSNLFKILYYDSGNFIGLSRGYKEYQEISDIVTPEIFTLYYISKENTIYYYSSGNFVKTNLVKIVDLSYNGTSVTKFDVRPVSGLSANYINTALGYTPYNSSNPSGYITRAVDDNSTTSTTLGWSASKLNGIIGDIETTINTIRGV